MSNTRKCAIHKKLIIEEELGCKNCINELELSLELSLEDNDLSWDLEDYE